MSGVLNLINSPWALEKNFHGEMLEIYQTHLKGEKVDLKALEARLGAPMKGTVRGYEVRSGVAILPIDGLISKRMNLLTQVSGGTSLELLGQDFKTALDDPTVHSIIMAVDSPGGATMGLQEVGDAIFAARGVKPVVAWTDGYMASAAYWLGSAASKVYISSDTTMVGSIGVIFRHVDKSVAEEKAGIKTTPIYAGKYKAMGDGPLDDVAREDIQAKVDTLYTLFVDTVARNRGVDTAAVRERMADARVFLGQDAVRAGLVDGVATLDDLIRQLNSGNAASPRTPAAGAAAESVELSAELPQAGAPEPAAEPLNQPENHMITKDFILANHPDIAEAFRAEGFARGRTDGMTAGATAELERIRSVEAQALPGHTDLVNKLKFDGKTTGPEAAAQVLAAERGKLGQKAADILADAGALSGAAPSAGGQGAGTEKKPEADTAPAEVNDETIKAAWDKDANLRAEFGGQFAAYSAFAKAEAAGRVKVLHGKASA